MLHACMRSKGIVHGDLKPDNLLLKVRLVQAIVAYGSKHKVSRGGTELVIGLAVV